MTDVGQIIWGVGSAWGLGRIVGTDLRVERMRTMDKKLMFLVSDDEYTYLHCDSQRFDTMEELEAGVIEWAVESGRMIRLH